MSELLTLVKLLFLDSARNKLETFFSILFPVVFLIIFGFVFGSTGESARTVGIVGADVQVVKELESVGKWRFQLFPDCEELMAAVQNGKLSIGLSMNGSSVELFYNERNTNVLGEVKMLQIVVKNLLEEKLNNARSYFTVSKMEHTPTGKEISTFEHILTGVIAISVLSNGMFSMITVFGNYRKKGALRRIILTPVKPVKIVSAVAFVRILMSFLSLFITLFLARLFFSASIPFNWFRLISTLVFSTLGMMALGLFLTAIFKQPQTASSVASLLNTIMMFFAGVYFPVHWMPSYVRWLAYVLPVKYVADLVRV
ncbi:MAG: ABC transporter permease, partial [Pseudothermotoga sp.]|nr:ABC transporter permease [Pseudothermotoga sp.]